MYLEELKNNATSKGLELPEGITRLYKMDGEYHMDSVPIPEYIETEED